MRWRRAGHGDDRREALLSAAKPVTVVLVRHGKTPTTGKVLPGRAPGLHLSPEGRQEAGAAAESVVRLHPKIAAIYTSPMERAVETAAELASITGMEPEPLPALIECDFGEWTGLELAKVRRKKEWQAVVLSASRFLFPGGESLSELQARMQDAIAGWVQAYAGKTVVAYTHADPIRAMACDALGMHLDAIHRINVHTASLTTVVAASGWMRLESLNVKFPRGERGKVG